MKTLHCLYKDEKGVTAVEYGVIIGVVALSAFATVKLFGEVLRAFVLQLLWEILW